ncbi:MAG TPA: hypothetical protein PL070_18290, partial [Flavobacteriales bacterium]|nr:hypothetical protein [Flavobacteriales bacterium]
LSSTAGWPDERPPCALAVCEGPPPERGTSDHPRAQDVTIKKLTRKNPTMTQKFAELKDGDGGEAE